MKKYLGIGIIGLMLMFAVTLWAVDTTYQTKTYRTDGGDTEVIASGGKITVESGGAINVSSGGIIDVSGTFVAGTVTSTGDVSGNSVHGSTITASGDVSGNTVHASTITASGDVSGNSIHGSSVVSSGAVSGTSITGSGDISGNTVHASTVTASGDISGNSVHGSTVTASGDVSGNSVHASTATFSGLVANKVALTSAGGLLVSSTLSDASLEALVSIYLEVSGSATLTSTQMQSPKCTIVNAGSGSDASYNLPVDISGNLACTFQSATTATAKWGVHTETAIVQVADSSPSLLTVAGAYARFDQAVVGQSFKCWSQKSSLTTWGWICKPEVITTGRSFNDL